MGSHSTDALEEQPRQALFHRCVSCFKQYPTFLPENIHSMRQSKWKATSWWQSTKMAYPITVDEQQPVPLTFTHVMAKLVVNLTYKNQWGGIPTVEKVAVGNAAKEATINYLTKVVTPSHYSKGRFLAS